MTKEYLLEQYFAEKQKHRQVNEISSNEKEIIFSAIMIISFSEHEDKTTHTDSFKQILELLKQSRSKKTLLPQISEIFENNTKTCIAELKAQQEKVFKSIIGSKNQEYRHLQKSDISKNKIIVEKIRLNCFNKKENLENVFIYETLNKIIKSISLSSLFISSDLLQCKINDDENEVLYGLASIIDNPKRMSIYNIELEPKWKTFPLRWYSHKFDIPQLRKYFKLHEKGESLNRFIEEFVSDNSNEIKKKLENHFYNKFANRSFVLDNCIRSHEKELFASSICTALPLIEGLIWEFAEFYNNLNHNIFKNISGERYLILTNGKTIKDYSIGNLLKRSKLCDFFDENFINYYCDELYNERNPILHGNDIISFCKLNSSKKILTIDYLTDVMNDLFKRHFFSNMDEMLGDRILNKVLDRKPLNDKDKREIAQKTKNKRK